MKAGFVCLMALCAGALPVMAANLTAGYGLVDAIANSEPPGCWPFRIAPEGMFSGGAAGGSSTHAIDRSGENCWAPESVYQLERYGAMSVTFSNLIPGNTYVVELHLTENYFGGSNGGEGAGVRIFNVTINGTAVLSNYDIYVAAGGPYTAICKQFISTANSSGQMIIQFTNVKDNGHFSGITIWGQRAPAAVSNFSAVPNGSSMAFAWNGTTDVLRYYIQKSESANGPWTDLGVCVPETASTTIEGCYNATLAQHYRVVASNGVGTVASSVVSFAAPSNYTDIPTRGAVIANNSAANVRIKTVGTTSDPLNVLAADTVTVAMLMQDAPAESTLAMGANQFLKTGAIGVLTGAGNLIIGDTVGQGSVTGVGGSIALRADDAASELTLNAKLANDGETPLQVATFGEGTIILSSGIDYTGSLTLGGGTFRFTPDPDSSLGVTLYGTGALEKRGAGLVNVMTPSPDFTGDFVIAEGTARLGVSGVFPNGGTRVVIKDGATLDVASDAIGDQGMDMGMATIVVSGSGVDGQGAIVNNSTHSQYNSFHIGELVGDVVFGGTNSAARWDFRNSGDYRTFKMNGHSITKVGANMVCLTGMTLTEGGPAVSINVNEGTWSSETTTSYSGGAAHTMNVASGALFDLYAMTVPFSWTLNLADGGKINFRNGTLAQNVIAGPVNLTSGTVVASGGGNGTITGSIAGEGGLRSSMNAGYRLTLNNGNNTYAGGTQVTGGDLYATARGDLPGYDNPALLSVDAGTLVLPVDSSDWTIGDVETIIDNNTLKSENASIGLDVAGTLAFDEPFSLTMGGLAKFGAGLLTLEKKLWLPSGRLEVSEGTLTLANGDDNYVTGSGISVLKSATLNITSGSKVVVPVASCNLPVGTADGQTARLTVQDSTLITEVPLEYNVNSGGIMLGNADRACAVMAISGDSLISNKVVVANATDSQAAVYQNGGTLINSGGANNDIRVGQNGYGYYELNDGTLVFQGYSQVGGTGANSKGYFVQHGGDFEQNTEHTGRFAICRGANGGKGVVYQDGGTFRVLTNVQIGEWDNTRGGESWWTIDGAAASAYIQDEVNLCNRTNHTAILNINNGGTLETKQIKSRTAAGAADKDTAHAYVNFNGGVLKVSQSGALFATGDNLPDAVTIYPNGAVIDTAFSATIACPLTAPAGRGIGSITLPSSVTSGTYIGPPDIAISGGGGVGASAIAIFDSANGKVTGVKITSPGFGYTSAPTVTITGGGSTASVTATATLADNGTLGGLTKRGTGSLSLGKPNTFGGTVRIEDGALELGCDGAYPAGNDLELVGGALQGYGAVTAGAVRVESGVLSGLRVSASSFTKTGPEEVVLSGTKVTMNARPGLLAGVLDGAFNTADANPATIVASAPVMANSTAGWNDNTTWVYSGYIWNRQDTPATWTFCKFFDDSMQLMIDDAVLISNGNWADVVKATVTLDPGPHTFELRLGQGGGGAGPSGNTGSDLAKIWNAAGIGFAIDFEGRDTVDDPSFFTKPENYAGDQPLFTTDLSTGRIELREGVVTVGAPGAGLYAGVLPASFDEDSPNPRQSIVFLPEMGNQTTGWSDNTTWVYSGYIWNRSDNPVTWSFAECVDDNVLLKIDGETLIRNTTWNDISVATRTISPGPHTFEVRFGQGGGGAGPAGTFGSLGFAIDFLGRGTTNPSDYQVPSDPGDGSLFTTAIDISNSGFAGEDSVVIMGKDAVLRTQNNEPIIVPNMTASGIVDIGSLSIANTLYVNCADLLEGASLTVEEGVLNLAECRKIVIENIDLLGNNGLYTVASAANGITGSLDAIEIEGMPDDSAWTLTIRDTRLILGYQSGTFIILH
ncbi:MAG: hypothetical protein J6336_03125 [Kiritimatiellae bacterium]|nr:hypothetical protein [Kiritimatiellia bacterium]